MSVEFKGNCVGVRLTPRSDGNKDKHILVTILIEDDEHWSEKVTVSSHWLQEMIHKLQEAAAHCSNNEEPDMYDMGGNQRQFGWKFKK